MGRVPPSKLEEEVKKQENEVYGTDYVDSGDGVYADTEELVEDVIGNEPEEGESFSMAEEVEDDEKDLRSLGEDDDDSSMYSNPQSDDDEEDEE